MLAALGRHNPLIQPFGKLIHISTLESGHSVWFQQIERDGLIAFFSVSDHNNLVQLLRLFEGNDNNTVGRLLSI